MATILIVDDRPANREFLVTLLGYGGHRLLEAADGAEALDVTRAERPDLVIADILMPTMDGYEFVRRLRADPAVGDTRVVFCTAHYHEPEARKLAADCGVADVLTKPCEPEVVLRTVEAALGPAPPPAPAPPADEFDREHLHLLTDKLSQQADELRRTNERLTALADLGLQLGSERDPGRLLQVFCDAAREIVGARYAAVGVPDGTGSAYRHFLTSGLDVATTARVGRPDPPAGVLGSVLAAGRCFRVANQSGLEAAGVPASFPQASALLAAPVVSPARVHGWVCLLDKVGADAFTDEDERLAKMLGSQVGRIYENGSLYADLLRHSTKLADEVAQRKRGEAALRESEERFRGAFEYTAVATVLTDTDNRFVRVNTAFARTFGYSPPEMLGMTLADVTHPDDLAESHARRDRLLAEEGHFFQMEKRYRHRDGHTFWGLTNVALVRDPDGRPVSYVGQVQDVSERKRAETEARDARAAAERGHAQLRAVVESMADGVVVADPDGNLLDWNPAALRLHGFGSVGEARRRLSAFAETFTVTRPDGSALPFDDWPMARVLRGEAVADEKLVLRRPDTGIELILVFNGAPVRGPGGGVELGVVTIHDVTERERAEREARRTAELLRAVADGTTDAVFVKDRAGRYLLCNPATARFIGRPADEILGRDDAELFEPDSARLVMSRDRLVMESDRPHTDEETLVVAGASRTFLATKAPYRDARGNVIGVIGVSRDITEKRRLAAERDGLLARLQLQFERMPLAYVLFDAGLRVTDWNPAAERILGYTREEALGMGPFDLIPPSFQGEGAGLLARIRAGDMAAHSVNENVTKSGRPVVCEWFNTPLLTTGGRFDGLLCLAQDVTERKQLEGQVRQVQERLEHVLTSSPSVLYTLAGPWTELRPTWISENVRDMLGYPTADVLGLNWWHDRVHPDDRPRVLVELEHGLSAAGRVTQEYRFQHRDGTYRWIGAELRALRDPAGQPLEVVGSWSDITSRKALEDQFRQAQKMEAVGQLAGGRGPRLQQPADRHQRVQRPAPPGPPRRATRPGSWSPRSTRPGSGRPG